MTGKFVCVWEGGGGRHQNNSNKTKWGEGGAEKSHAGGGGGDLEGSGCKKFPPLKGVSLERLVHHLSTDPHMHI